MALLLTKTAKSGAVIQDAIHRVTDINVAIGGETTVVIAMFVDGENTVPVEQSIERFMSDVAGGNLFQQCYVYLKTLPEYVGALDV